MQVSFKSLCKEGSTFFLFELGEGGEGKREERAARAKIPMSPLGREASLRPPTGERGLSRVSRGMFCSRKNGQLRQNLGERQDPLREKPAKKTRRYTV